MTRPQARAAAHISALPVSLGGVVGLRKELVTAVPQIMRMRSRPLDERLMERSAYELETQGRVHGRERIVNE